MNVGLLLAKNKYFETKEICWLLKVIRCQWIKTTGSKNRVDRNEQNEKMVSIKDPKSCWGQFPLLVFFSYLEIFAHSQAHTHARMHAHKHTHACTHSHPISSTFVVHMHEFSLAHANTLSLCFFLSLSHSLSCTHSLFLDFFFTLKASDLHLKSCVLDGRRVCQRVCECVCARVRVHFRVSERGREREMKKWVCL